MDGKDSRPSSSASAVSTSSNTLQGNYSTAKSPDLSAALAAAAVACILRPTNGIIWMTVAGSIMFQYSNATRSIALVRSALVVGYAGIYDLSTSTIADIHPVQLSLVPRYW